MVGAKTGVAKYTSEIESHAHLTHYHGDALQLVVGETIKAIKTMRVTLDAAIELNKLRYSLKRQEASNRLREDTAPGNFRDKALCSNRRTVRGTLSQSI